MFLDIRTQRWEKAVFAVLMTTLCIATTRANDMTKYEFCMAQCENLFNLCIRAHCPERSGPVIVPQKCNDERSNCIEYCQQYNGQDR
ncbi:hypothetical protein LSAT2_001864 [Lamellibrachia satsuma]|nr:hypothetical protein LSAT2_001864 [Lamellibrachia satsuma]